MKALGKGSVASVVGVGLTIVHIALIVAFAVVVLVLLGVAATAAGVHLGWLDSLTADGDLRIDSGGVRITQSGDGVLSWPLFVLAGGAAVVALSGALVIVGRLKLLFNTFTSNQPFSRANADHLRVIWITMMVIELSKYVLTGGVIAGLVHFGRPEGVDMDVNFEFDLSAWAAILILIVLAEVFREGARIHEENQLTI